MKVPICWECRDSSGLEETAVDGKPIMVCSYCGNKASSVEETRLHNGNLPTNDPMKVLGDFHSASSYAIRAFTTPLGKVRMNVSTNSNFCHSVTADGVVSKSIKRYVDSDWSSEAFSSVLAEYPENMAGVFQTLAIVSKIVGELQRTVNPVVELDLDAE